MPTDPLSYWPVAAFILGAFSGLLKWQQSMYERRIDQMNKDRDREVDQITRDRDEFRSLFFQSLNVGERAAALAESAKAKAGSP